MRGEKEWSSHLHALRMGIGHGDIHGDQGVSCIRGNTEFHASGGRRNSSSLDERISFHREPKTLKILRNWGAGAPRTKRFILHRRDLDSLRDIGTPEMILYSR